MQINTNNVNNTWALLQTTGGKSEPNIVFCCCCCENSKGHGTQNVTFDTQYDFIDIILNSGESRGAIPLQVYSNIRFSIFVWYNII